MASYRLLQLSDVHLRIDNALAPGVAPRDHLDACLDALSAAWPRPDIVVLTGDLADEGDGSCYEQLLADLRGCPVLASSRFLFVPGNHDDRASFREHLLGVPGTGGAINQVLVSEGLRVVGLDSVVPGSDHGRLEAATLEFLREQLASPAADGTVLALHHPPIPSPIEPLTRIMLEEPELLAKLVANHGVRLILAGHNHHELLGELAGTPVWVGPSTAYRADVTSPSQLRRLPGAAMSLIDVDEHGVRCYPVSVR